MSELVPCEASFQAMFRGLVGAGRTDKMRPFCETEWRGHTAQQMWEHGDCVYLIQEENHGATKVGIAVHPMRRFESIQCGNPRTLRLRAIYLGSRRDCIATERAVLREFKATRSREWIHAPCDRIAAFIENQCGEQQ